MNTFTSSSEVLVTEAMDVFIEHKDKIATALSGEELRNLCASTYSLLGEKMLPVKSVNSDVLFTGVSRLKDKSSALLSTKRHDALLMYAIALRLYVRDFIS